MFSNSSLQLLHFRAVLGLHRRGHEVFEHLRAHPRHRLRPKRVVQVALEPVSKALQPAVAQGLVEGLGRKPLAVEDLLQAGLHLGLRIDGGRGVLTAVLDQQVADFVALAILRSSRSRSTWNRCRAHWTSPSRS